MRAAALEAEVIMVNAFGVFLLLLLLLLLLVEASKLNAFGGVLLQVLLDAFGGVLQLLLLNEDSAELSRWRFC